MKVWDKHRRIDESVSQIQSTKHQMIEFKRRINEERIMQGPLKVRNPMEVL